jgi:hypothetical protein
VRRKLPPPRPQCSEPSVSSLPLRAKN